jgi:hypothetical protein
MLTHYRAVKEVGIRIGAAVDGALESLRDRRVEQEPAFTDRMLGRIEQTMDEFRSRGIHWKAKTLTDRGRGSQESIDGADFLVSVDFDLFDYKTSKGFLAQAKLLKFGQVDNLAKLKEQCGKMLELTPVSYVFLYDTESVRVVSANSVVASSFDPTNCYSWSAKHFFEEHLKCIIGDSKIHAATPEVLAELRERFEARSALRLEARPDTSLNFINETFAVVDRRELDDRRLLPARKR